MGMRANPDDVSRIAAKLSGLFENMTDDLKLVGEVAASAIVQTTLAGIGEGDQPFAPYSPAYKAVLDAVGGKPRQTVDLRGLFYHDGQERKKYRNRVNPERSRHREGEGRQAYVGVAFASLKSGVRSFQGKTGITRPQLGLTDPRSEMSLDLIQIEAADRSIRIIYEPRDVAYMIAHQNGDDKQPQRKWFTANKTAVRAGMVKALEIVLKARASWFNDHGDGPAPTPAKPPSGGGPVKSGGMQAVREAMAGGAVAGA